MAKAYNKDLNIHNYIQTNVKTIIIQLIKNFDGIRDNYVIIVVGKMLRKIIKNKVIILALQIGFNNKHAQC